MEHFKFFPYPLSIFCYELFLLATRDKRHSLCSKGWCVLLCRHTNKRKNTWVKCGTLPRLHECLSIEPPQKRECSPVNWYPNYRPSSTVFLHGSAWSEDGCGGRPVRSTATRPRRARPAWALIVIIYPSFGKCSIFVQLAIDKILTDSSGDRFLTSHIPFPSP